MRAPRIALASLLVLISLSALRGAPEGRPPLEGPVVPPALKGRGLHILVEKAARRLVLYRDAKEVHRFPVGLGFAPVGPKEVEGDGKTPEGEYRVCMKNPKSQFHLSLGITYPGPHDAERGLAAKVLTEAQAKSIRSADRRGACPPWNTALGGVIFIHGSGSSSDWTLGCVALDDADMDILYREASVGTPVTIRP